MPKRFGINLVTRITRSVLRPGGGVYSDQIRNERLADLPPSLGYRRGVANMCSFELDAFWMLCESCGFTPHAVQLVPRSVEVPDERYAYFLLIR